MKNTEKKKFNPFKSVAVCLCSLMFVASFALFAVSLALSLVDITAGGHISFTAHAVNANVTGIVKGTKTTNTLTDITIDESIENFTTPTSWSNMTLDFTEDNLIKFIVNIKNTGEQPIYASIDSNASGITNLSTRIYYMYDGDGSMWSDISDYEEGHDESTLTQYGEVFKILTSEESTSETQLTFVVYMNVENVNKSLSKDINFNINLSVDMPESCFTYSIIDESAATIELTGFNSAVGGDCTLPSKLTINNKEYTVTRVTAERKTNAYTSDDICSWEGFNPTTLTIPSTITEIRSGLVDSGYASIFSVCSSLTSLTFEDSTGWKLYLVADGGTETLTKTFSDGEINTADGLNTIKTTLGENSGASASEYYVLRKS